MSKRTIHPDFLNHLKHKDQSLIDLYTDLREYVLEMHPKSNELLYHTHALTSLYTVLEKMGDGFCMIPIYTNHLNLGFNKGTVINDPKKLLQGTGKWIRHIPIKTKSDYRNKDVETLIKSAIDLALEDTTAKYINQGLIISKIKN
ncbi:DUF5655 domain-containing protein [Psychroserpens jangbogonensis]|uniref:DUF5655 domain-containing protein n=1 Tax=Psychroserpens jangbogonensis TaxID=1484460 RepID=UPI00053EE6A7|nr:DUF5655 domain-containing protein [Psychroserpens jangbogonensis]